MRIILLVACGLATSLASTASAVNIYMLSSGDPGTDGAAEAALTAHGHTVRVGVEYTAFDGTVNLAEYQTVYLQCNANWTTAGAMPAAGQQQLIDWVNAGGRLVTSEWVIYYTYPSGGKFTALGAILPAPSTFSYGTVLTAMYTAMTPHPVINAGLPSSFEFPMTSYTGTETYAVARPGATVFYTTSNSPTAFGLAGWAQGSGSVFSFTSTCGPAQVADTNFGRLFANVMMANAGGPAPCYANCDGSTGTPVLNVNDFVCFQTRFAGADPYADCDQSSSLNVNDFVCFQTRFAAGCP